MCRIEKAAGDDGFPPARGASAKLVRQGRGSQRIGAQTLARCTRWEVAVVSVSVTRSLEQSRRACRCDRPDKERDLWKPAGRKRAALGAADYCGHAVQPNLAAHRLVTLAEEREGNAMGIGQIETKADPHRLPSRSIPEAPSAVRLIRMQTPSVGSRPCWASPRPSKTATHRLAVESGVLDNRARFSSDVVRYPSFAA